ncbi:hypothetical protein SCUP515_13355, partial [Seiridium cupressi]
MIPALRSDGKLTNLTIKKALYSETAPFNMLSDGQLKIDGLVFDGCSDTIVIKKSRLEVAAVTWVNQVAVLKVKDSEVPKSTKSSSVIPYTNFGYTSTPRVTYKQMHERMFHAGPERVLLACKRAGIPVTRKEAYSYSCEACKLGKAHSLVSHIPAVPAQRPLSLIFLDTIPHETGHGFKKHTVHAIDAYCTYHWIRFTKDKSTEAVSDVTINLILMLERQTAETVQAVQIDNGTEFPKFIKWFQGRGGVVRLSVADHHEMVGRVEK